MKKLILSVGVLVAAAACGGGGSDKQALFDSCLTEGETKETCSCMVDAMEENLSPALLKKMATAAKDGSSDPSEMMGELSVEEQGEFMKLIPSIMTCSMPEGMEMPTGE